jgi:ribosomal protein S18 acetylase RimI-like enzyme
MVMVRDITMDDWKLLRDVRLDALSEAPSAFGSTYAREATFTEEQWRDRISDRSVTFFGYADPGFVANPLDPASTEGDPEGLAGVYVEDREAELVSMWVRPSARGQGVGQTLVRAAALWAQERGYPALYLWVTETNESARRLYERCGFAPTGDRQPLPSSADLQEVRMRLPL